MSAYDIIKATTPSSLKGGTMIHVLNNQHGTAMIYALIFLVMASITGPIMLKVVKNDRNNVSHYNKNKSAAQAASTALKACEETFLSKPEMSLKIFEKYTNDTSFKWLLGSDSTANIEHKHLLQQEGNTRFSANIIDFGSPDVGSCALARIQGIGYGRHGGSKTVIAQYELQGLNYEIATEPGYGLYIGGEGYDFNSPIHVIGDAYFASGFRFNSPASGTIIDGRLKTGNTNYTSEFNAKITINGNAYFQTPIKLQNDNIIINGKAAFKRNLELSKDIVIADNAFITSSISGSSKLDLSGHDGYHTGSCNDNNFKNYGTISNSGSITLWEKVGIPDGNETPLQMNIGIVNSYAKNFSTLGFTDLTGTNLQTTYNNTPTNQKWNDYLVIKIPASGNVPNLNTPNGTFNGKVIWIIEKNLPVNQKWYASGPNSVTILYVTDGTISQFGWPGTMKGLIYVTGSGKVDYSFKPGSSLEGSILHVNPATGFQVNTSSIFTISYNSTLVDNLASQGFVTKPTYNMGNGTLTLVDSKIRPKLLSIQYM